MSYTQTCHASRAGLKNYPNYCYYFRVVQHEITANYCQMGGEKIAHCVDVLTCSHTVNLNVGIFYLLFLPWFIFVSIAFEIVTWAIPARVLQQRCEVFSKSDSYSRTCVNTLLRSSNQFSFCEEVIVTIKTCWRSSRSNLWTRRLLVNKNTDRDNHGVAS